MKTYKEFLSEGLNEDTLGDHLKEPIKVKVKGVDFDLKFKKDKGGITASLENKHGKKVISKTNPSNQSVDEFLKRMLSVYKIAIQKA